MEVPNTFEEQLKDIQDPNIREFTELALDNVDPEFYIAPCCSSGKNHPAEDNGKGGLVRHVKKGLVIIKQFAERAQFSQTEFDIAYAAFILHDCCKNGIPWTDKTDYTHGYLEAKWLEQFPLEEKYVKECLLNAVRFHMTPWVFRHPPWGAEEFTQQQVQENWQEMQRAQNLSRVEQAVVEADYWSSRNEMSFLPGASIIDGKHDSPPYKLVREYGVNYVNGKLVLPD